MGRGSEFQVRCRCSPLTAMFPLGTHPGCPRAAGLLELMGHRVEVDTQVHAGVQSLGGHCAGPSCGPCPASFEKPVRDADPL